MNRSKMFIFFFAFYLIGWFFGPKIAVIIKEAWDELPKTTPHIPEKPDNDALALDQYFISYKDCNGSDTYFLVTPDEDKAKNLFRVIFVKYLQPLFYVLAASATIISVFLAVKFGIKYAREQDPEEKKKTGRNMAFAIGTPLLLTISVALVYIIANTYQPELKDPTQSLETPTSQEHLKPKKT